MPFKCLVNGLTTNYLSDFDLHDLSASRAHHHCLSGLLALSRLRRRHSICRLLLPRRLYHRQETLLAGKLASVAEAQAMAKHHDSLRAVAVLDRKMERDPAVHLPRPENRGWKQSRSLHHLAQSMQVLANC